MQYPSSLHTPRLQGTCEEQETEKRLRVTLPLRPVPSAFQQTDNAVLRATIQQCMDHSYEHCIPADLRRVFWPYSGRMDGFDLSDLNFTLADMHGLDFTGVNFRGCTFVRTNLTRCILRRTDFSRADLTRANLSETVMDSTTFAYTRFTKAIFTHVMPVHTSFAEALDLELPTHLQYLLEP